MMGRGMPVETQVFLWPYLLHAARLADIYGAKTGWAGLGWAD